MTSEILIFILKYAFGGLGFAIINHFIYYGVLKLFKEDEYSRFYKIYLMFSALAVCVTVYMYRINEFDVVLSLGSKIIICLLVGVVFLGLYFVAYYGIRKLFLKDSFNFKPSLDILNGLLIIGANLHAICESF